MRWCSCFSHFLVHRANKGGFYPNNSNFPQKDRLAPFQHKADTAHCLYSDRKKYGSKMTKDEERENALER